MKEFINVFAWPRFVLALVNRGEDDVQTCFFARLQKRDALEVAGEA
jgi:hypothetical protein